MGDAGSSCVSPLLMIFCTARAFLSRDLPELSDPARRKASDEGAGSRQTAAGGSPPPMRGDPGSEGVEGSLSNFQSEMLSGPVEPQGAFEERGAAGGITDAPGTSA